MSAGASTAKGTEPAKTAGGPIARLLLFFRQVVAELRKVVWPTRKEMRTYFVVVVVFIVAIMAYTGILDAIFDRIVMWVFA